MRPFSAFSSVETGEGLLAARQLTLSLGGVWRGNAGNAPCPVCQPERRRDQHGLSVRSEEGRLLAYCHKAGCDFRDIVKAAGLPPDALRHDRDEARKADAQGEADAAARRAKARKLWASSAPICGTRGEAYLRGRGITCPLPPSLRWAADTFHGPSGRWLAAMVADVSTGGIHRTFFEKAGGRIAGNAKMMQGPCAGGAVALSEGPGPLVVCEGTWSIDGVVTAWINLKAGLDRIELSYRYRRSGGEWEDMCLTVPLATTPCRFGGLRYWFLCPGEGCGRRVGVLYGARHFLCRHCTGAAYTSQTEDKIDRLARKASKIRHRLGWPGGVRSPPGYLKPEGMHWKTFSRLCLEHRKLSYLVDLHFVEKYRKRL